MSKVKHSRVIIYPWNWRSENSSNREDRFQIIINYHKVLTHKSWSQLIKFSYVRTDKNAGKANILARYYVKMRASTLKAAIGFENRYRHTNPLNKTRKFFDLVSHTPLKESTKLVEWKITYYPKEEQSIQELLQLIPKMEFLNLYIHVWYEKVNQ